MHSNLQGQLVKPRPLIPRTLQLSWLQAAREFPAIGLTGPRESGQTIGSHFGRALYRWLKYAGKEAGQPYLVYGGDKSFDSNGVQFVGWKDLPRFA